MSPTFDIRDLQLQAEEFVAATRSAAERVAEATAKRRAGDSARADKLAQERLNGDHGRDWKVLQERIDMRRTTLQDIFCGLDHSPEARAVREILGKNIARTRSTLIEASNDPDGELARTLFSATTHQTEIH